MGVRHKGRQIALQVLYQWDVAGVPLAEALATYREHLNPSPEAFEFARELVEGVKEKKDELDALISRYSRNWRLERMLATDRNILRLATYELLFRPDIPPKVSLNEAVELAKEFGSEDSPAFVNGILDAIYRHEVRPRET
ncbi:transcription antitermination factor NusB [Thermosulfurimonas marina]|uniref:Transcription antitermination protein NusB n=1 Tax=Thermosulfurimonas marina TaxID=2047767 RepID=A0A6H1WU50_9BACT|nr:transcription antitermination factor NusB [Thermosulfurimonas marina]QJA06710.1 transcription antitermination factor NusB [Thermosulfurimonas marina]